MNIGKAHSIEAKQSMSPSAASGEFWVIARVGLCFSASPKSNKADDAEDLMPHGSGTLASKVINSGSSAGDMLNDVHEPPMAVEARYGKGRHC